MARPDDLVVTITVDLTPLRDAFEHVAEIINAYMATCRRAGLLGYEGILKQHLLDLADMRDECAEMRATLEGLK